MRRGSSDHVSYYDGPSAQLGAGVSFVRSAPWADVRVLPGSGRRQRRGQTRRPGFDSL